MMITGDLVKCNNWVYSGRTGVVLEVQSTDYCAGAYIFLNIGIKLIRLENLEVVNENR